jgi:hypothetical protein
MTIFTAKWVYTVDGLQHERLIETDQVSVAYDERTPNGEKPVESPQLKLGIYNVPLRNGLVVLGNPYEGSESMALAFGTVYVMNRDGKTIAKYHLAKPGPWVNGTDRPERFSEAMPSGLVPA